jgi:hypothetical protein
MATTKRNVKPSASTQSTIGTSAGSKPSRRAVSRSDGRAEAEITPTKNGDASIAPGAQSKKRAVSNIARADQDAARPTARSKGSKSGGDVFRSGSKGAAIVALLSRKNGATISELANATGWQAHSVRGFLSGSLKKKLGMDVASEKGGDGQRRYHIAR